MNIIYIHGRAYDEDTGMLASQSYSQSLAESQEENWDDLYSDEQNGLPDASLGQEATSNTKLEAILLFVVANALEVNL